VKLGLLFAFGGALAAFGGCSVGQGSGSAIGSLFVVSCNDMANFGTPIDGGTGYMIAPRSYSLGPKFFAGAPDEDLIQGPGAMNQLSIRMASSGLLEMYTDFLEFDVTYSYEVARCIRGRTINGGQPDYLVNAPLPLTFATAANPAPTTLWCDWTGMAFSGDGGAPDAAVAGAPDAGASLDGGMSTMAAAPRIHLTPYTDLIGSIGLFQTCPNGNQAGTVMDGWIQFSSFGNAEQNNLPPEQREQIQPNFVINFGDRLSATFHVVIGDTRYVTAVQMGTTPPTAPNIGGTLDGYFDFNLARGRSAQPFP
jgi:hypothetical protein